ncbi:MAG: efflux RND transporter permease subunit, partial [Candidatus Delongbacteria bacterium]
QRSVRDIAEHIVKKRLEQIEGVAMADVIGGEELDIRIEADIEKMNSFGISFSNLTGAVRAASTNSPGGTIKDDVYIYDLVISSEFENLSDIENTLIRQLSNKRNIYLKDVATVSYRQKEKRSFTRYNSKNSTAVLIRKDGDANAVLVAESVKQTMTELDNSLDVKINLVYDQSEFITESIRNVVSAILLGGLLSFLTLFLFLREFKAPFNISLAMPISIFSTFTLLYFFDISLNLMSLSGFALGIGMLVDNSIVVLENIDRRRKDSKNIFDACYNGVKEVVMPVTASTFTTIIVFMPVVFVTGVAGELFKDQSFSVAFALISSLFVSIALVPVLYNKMSFDKTSSSGYDRSITPDNGPIFKTGIYWTVLILAAYFIVKMSSIPVDVHTFVYILFVSLLADPVIKTFEYFIFQRRRSALKTAKNVRFTIVNLLWLSLIILLTLPAAYMSRIDFFEPVHALISSFELKFLYGFDMVLYNISSNIYEIFQPYEEEMSTKSFMLYSYVLGGLVFLLNLFGVFNPSRLYRIPKDAYIRIFYVEGIRSVIKNILASVSGFIIGLFIFYYKSAVKALKFIFRPVLAGFDRSYRLLESYYHKLLLKALDNKMTTLFSAFILLMISVLLLTVTEKRMMPEVDSHEFILSVELSPGTSIAATEKVVAGYEKILNSKDGVLSYFSTGGIFDEKSLLSGATVYKADIQVKLDKNTATNVFVNDLRRDIEKYNSQSPFNIKLSINTDISVLGEMLKTEEGDVAVKIYGNDLDDMSEISEKVIQELSSFENLGELRSDFSGSKPQIRLGFKNSFLDKNNLTEQEISSYIRTIIKGDIVTEITENNKSLDIIIGTSEDYGEDIKNVLNSIYKKNGVSYPVSKLVKVNYEKGPESIKHESQVRTITVSAALTEGRIDRMTEKISSKINKIGLYRGMRIEVGGQNTETKDSMDQIIFIFLLSFLLVYMVLASQFESLLSPFIIVLSVPFAVVGVGIGLFITGQSINILSGIGMIMLIGIVVNDAIVKVDFIENGVKSGKSVRDAIIDASRKRLRPILMTTVSTVFGMLPMALAFEGSSELRRPLAITVIFGLSAATMLILVILPVIYETLKRK